mmetsp:Transcript_19871/g.43440  ORF Transcript_19871/g.43440 Transcript_19871/m.43440 type:complete len:155 (-) Transcript_19871:1498-1962(-)
MQSSQPVVREIRGVLSLKLALGGINTVEDELPVALLARLALLWTCPAMGDWTLSKVDRGPGPGPKDADRSSSGTPASPASPESPASPLDVAICEGAARGVARGGVTEPQIHTCLRMPVTEGLVVASIRSAARTSRRGSSPSASGQVKTPRRILA